jgi:hypothetical protein
MIIDMSLGSRVEHAIMMANLEEILIARKQTRRAQFWRGNSRTQVIPELSLNKKGQLMLS